MFKEKKVAVVVPAHNEATQIEKTVQTIPDYIDAIVVIDDKSTDDTVRIVQALAAGNDRLVLLEHAVNQGVGGAIASGYKWARDKGYDIAVVMAGDGQMDPCYLPDLLCPVAEGRVDYTKTNRLLSSGAYHTIPKVRFYGNSALSLLTKIASGYWAIADSQSGYTAISANALHAIDWDCMYKRYGQPNDLLVRLNVHNFRVQDIETPPVYNVGEKSGIVIKKIFFPLLWLLLRLFCWRLKEKYILRDFHPLLLFYMLSFFMIVLNILFFIRLCILWSLQGVLPEITFIIWLFTFSNGLLCLFMAMWFDMENCRHLNIPVAPRQYIKE